MVDILGYGLLLAVVGGLIRSFIQEQKESPQEHSITFPDSSFYVTIGFGILIGGVLGLLLFWPSLASHRFTWEEVTHFYNKGGSDYDGFIAPWLNKTVLFAVVGGALAWAFKHFISKSAH
jgi:hypothetical protein